MGQPAAIQWQLPVPLRGCKIYLVIYLVLPSVPELPPALVAFLFVFVFHIVPGTVFDGKNECMYDLSNAGCM